MESLLTLTIAVGGIATGIGAIWAAVVARRQAQVTERSLAQTERSLAEQNERARLNLEVDLLTRLGDRFEGPHFLSRRRAAAKYLIENAFVGDDMVEVERLNRAVFDVLNFYEQLGELQRLGALKAESVWNTFGIIARVYWTLYRAAIQKIRDKRKDPTIYENFEGLNRLVADLYSERGIEPLTQIEVRRIVEHEAIIGE